MQAQNVLSGTVYLKNEKVIGANITCFDEKTNVQVADVKSDFEGAYTFSTKSSTVILKVKFSDLPELIDTIKLLQNEVMFHNLVLQEVAVSKSILITKQKKVAVNSEITGVNIQRNSGGITSIITREQFVKTGVRTSSDILKTIPGTTIVEGKFANIRGMNDRYNAGYLNGAPMPSTESDRKAFSFDIIPSNLIDNISIIKSGAPNLTGDFGGGIIQINTRSIPDKKVQSFGFGLQYNSLTTFKNVETFNGGKTEFLGTIDKQHQIPDLNGKLTGSPQENSTQTAKFNNDWNTEIIKPSLAPRFNYSIGLPIKLKNKKEIGVIASINYAYSPKYTYGDVRTYDLSDNRLMRDFSDRVYTVNVQNGGLLNLSYKINERNRIDFRNLYNINYDAASNFRTGLTDADDQKYGQAFSGFSTQNRLVNSQLSGIHSIATKAKSKNELLVTWNINTSSVNKSMPDYRIAQYSTFDTSRIFVFNDFFNAGSGRFFSSLTEMTINAAADISYKFSLNKITNNLKTGFYAQNRERDFTSRRFVYGPVNKFYESKHTPAIDLSTANLAKSGLYLIEKTSSDLDEYDATAKLFATYLMSETEIPLFTKNEVTKSLKLIYGARIENFTQVLNNDVFRKMGSYVSNQGSMTDILPSLNIMLPIGLKTQLRGSYYKSLNRPEMRELAPFSFYNFSLNSELLGNTKLVRAQIHNIDMKYEWYNGGSNTISIGGFYKKISNPIEMSLDPTQPGIRTFNYKNEKEATISGIELELRQNVGNVLQAPKGHFLNGLTLYSNFSLINSKVSFLSTSSGTPNRSLQGQSPFVVNTSLFYEAKSGFLFNITANKIGDRIAFIGTPKNIQPFGLDIYEYGRTLLDFQTGFNFGKNKKQQIKLNVSDLFAQKSVYYQDNNLNHKFDKGDNELIGMKNGRTVTLSYNLTF